jgi:hypothetical protein
MSVPITPGSGASSVAGEVVGGLNYQQIQVYGGGGASILGINPDRSINVSVVGTLIASVSGTTGASVIGIVPVQLSNSSVITVIQGSVAVAFAAAANQSVSGTVGASVIGHAPVVIVGGSIAASFTPPANQSVSGAVNVSSSVLLGSSNASVIVVGSFSPSGNQSVSGTVGASVIGTVPVTQTTTPWVVNFQNSSIIAINAGSVVTLSQGSVITINQAQSIVGTYAEDAAHTTGDKGLFALQVRNDTMSSVTSADGDYSPIAGGPVGETITANAPITKWIRGTADLRVSSGGSIAAIAAQGASIFTYITGIQVANMGSASVLVTFAGGLGSILGYTIAPAGGGSNITYPNALKTGENSAFTASISGVASVLVSAQGFISKT